MKTCVIIYHKNINKIYRTEWIEECINSILNQTYQDFYIYELNYGDSKINFSMYFDKYQDRYKLFNENMSNHAYAMNFLLDKCLEDNFDAVFNVNLDDYYHKDRFEKQLEKIKEGFDIVSSNIQYIRDNKFENIFDFSKYNKDISKRLEIENIIAHPTICYSKKFIQNVRYNPEEIPLEDYSLWKRLSLEDYKFFIVNSTLCYYRIHNKQVSYVESDEDEKSNSLKREKVHHKILMCMCGGLVKDIVSPNGTKYKICESCKRIF